MVVKTITVELKRDGLGGKKEYFTTVRFSFSHVTGQQVGMGHRCTGKGCVQPSTKPDSTCGRMGLDPPAPQVLLGSPH